MSSRNGKRLLSGSSMRCLTSRFSPNTIASGLVVNSGESKKLKSAVPVVTSAPDRQMKLTPRISGCSVRTKRPTRHSGRPACTRRSQSSATICGGFTADLAPSMSQSLMFFRSVAFMGTAFAAQVLETSSFTNVKVVRGFESCNSQLHVRVRRYDFAISRRTPEVCQKFLTLQSEGAGNAGRPMRPIAACAMIVVERTRVSQVTPESPGTPRAMVYGLYRALPGEPGFLATVTPEKLASQELDTSVGVSGPHDFAVRLSAVRQWHFSVHRIPPRVRDDREPPLSGTGHREYSLIFISEKQKYFCKGGWT